MPVSPRTILLSLAAAAALALPACGGDSNAEKGEAAEAGASPAVARVHASATSLAMVEALGSYRAGERQRAVDQVSEAYLQHFEQVEGALDRRDHQLKERLEEAIRDELRREMRRGAPAAKVTTLVRRIVRDLATAQAKLR
jgi:hypothetical protein